MPPKKRAAKVASPAPEDDFPPPMKQARGRAPAAAAEGSENQARKPTAINSGSTDASISGLTNVTSYKDKLVIPIDEGCPLGQYRVYIDADDSVVYDVSLNQTNASNNNNKFYCIQLLYDGGDYRTWTRWGRVGEVGKGLTLGNGSLPSALKEFEKKFKDKSGLMWSERNSEPRVGRYVYIEKSYEPDSDGDDQPAQAKAGASRRSISPPKCSLAPPVRSLVELIFNQKHIDAVMASMNYDANKLPLGKLNKTTIQRGFQALKDLSALLEDNSLAADTYGETQPVAVEHLSNRYYSLIPHAFGRHRPPVISTKQMLKLELELMESLSDLKDANDIMKSDDVEIEEVHPLDARFHGLGLEVTPLTKKSEEFKEITQYLQATCGSTHDLEYSVDDIFRIERKGETERFSKSPYASMAGNRKLLWHGSRTTNYGGILSQGLRIAPPEAPVSGYMFDKGLYLADMSSKSVNYCCSETSGGSALLLLCEAELGDPMQELRKFDYHAASKAKAMGMYSTFGQGATGPQAWKDAKCVHPSLAGVMMPDTSKPPGATNVQGSELFYNEYICYDVAQVKLRYLLRLRM